MKLLHVWKEQCKKESCPQNISKTEKKKKSFKGNSNTCGKNGHTYIDGWTKKIQAKDLRTGRIKENLKS